MRLYEMFMGPLDQVKPWQTTGIEGVSRFLHRVWRLVIDERSGELTARLTDAAPESEPALTALLHVTIRKVLEDTEALRFNTAIAQMMVFVNEVTASAKLPRAIERRSCAARALRAAPGRRAVEEARARGSDRLRAVAAARCRPCEEPTIELAVQVNGKRRDVITVPRDADAQLIERLAMESDGAVRILEGRPPRKVIVVPGRLVNIVV